MKMVAKVKALLVLLLLLILFGNFYFLYHSKSGK